MDKAAKLMIGEHDFRNFSKAQLERQDTLRVCFDASVSKIPDLPGMGVFSIRSSGFLYHQIRLTMTILGNYWLFYESVSLKKALFQQGPCSLVLTPPVMTSLVLSNKPMSPCVDTFSLLKKQDTRQLERCIYFVRKKAKKNPIHPSRTTLKYWLNLE